MTANHATFCGRIHRRTFLADVGMGFTGLALGAMLHRDGIARANEPGVRPPNGRAHFRPKAKAVRLFDGFPPSSAPTIG